MSDNKPYRINEIMTKRPITISKDLLLMDALEIMRAWGLRHLPVSEPGRVIGLLSDRDIFKHLAFGQNKNTQVQEAMSPNPYVVSGTESLAKIATVMAENKFGCAIVADLSGETIGIFTTTDALAILARLLSESDESEFKVMNISDYLKFHQSSFAV